MQPTDLTVSAIIERDGQYLMVEEIASGAVVLNQPPAAMSPAGS
jgi:hypothetical protein